MKPLSKTEIDFLRSLPNSDLERLLKEVPRSDQASILKALSNTVTTSKASDFGDSKQAIHGRQKYAEKQEIGPPPEVAEELLELREESNASLRRHLEICYPAAFTLPMSPDHERLIEKIDAASTGGGLFALAMPRGSGKTTIILRAAIWAILSGRRRFCSIVCSTDDAATKLLNGIKTELEFNPVLATLYAPELHCIMKLDGESRRANGQRCEGRRTLVEWKSDRIGFGNVEGLATCGSYISTCGLTGNIRGQFVTLTTGEVLRPDLVLVDDPQTKESAKSPQQCDDRHAIMMGDVLGMSGPSTELTGLCTCTVIYKDDLADRLLDRSKSPDWKGEKCKMVYKWPGREDLWEEYRAHYEQDLRAGGDGESATEFIRERYDEMHEGAEVGWEHRKSEKELSALHHAYNLRFKDEPTFFAEYQNSPLAAAEEIPFELDADEICRRVVNVPRNTIPSECQKITAFVDVQKDLLFYCVTSWTPDGRGHVIDYGSYPDQRRLMFSKRETARTLASASGADGLNESLYYGLEQLSEKLLGETYQREDGALMQIHRMGVDARWGFSTRVVRRFCRESQFRGRLNPMLGQYIGPSSRLWHQIPLKSNERGGINCRVQAPPKNERGVPEIIVHTNWWKSFAAERLLANKGADQSIVLFDGAPHVHRMFAEHCASEEPVIIENKVGNKVVEWKQTHSSLDNDFWDCLVGTCVLASLEGVRVHVETPPQQTPRKKRKREQVAPSDGGHPFFITARQ